MHSLLQEYTSVVCERPVAATATVGSVRDDFCKSYQLLAQHCRLCYDRELLDSKDAVQKVSLAKPSRCICAHVLFQLICMRVVQVASSALDINPNKVVQLDVSFQASIAIFIWHGLRTTPIPNTTGLSTNWQTDSETLVTLIRDIHAWGRVALVATEQEQLLVYNNIVSTVPTQLLAQDCCPYLVMMTACHPQCASGTSWRGSNGHQGYRSNRQFQQQDPFLLIQEPSPTMSCCTLPCYCSSLLPWQTASPWTAQTQTYHCVSYGSPSKDSLSAFLSTPTIPATPTPTTHLTSSWVRQRSSLSL